MILRVLRGSGPRGELPRLVDAVRTDISEWSSMDSSLASTQAAWRQLGDDIEFLLVSTWTTAESVLARGGPVELPRGRLAGTGILRDARASHYELMLERSNGELDADGIVRLSSFDLEPGHATAFYERVRGLWDELTRDAGLVATYAGRRLAVEAAHAVVVSAWRNAAALDAATHGGFVGGEGMGTFYTSDPTIEHFTALDLRGLLE